MYAIQNIFETKGKSVQKICTEETMKFISNVTTLTLLTSIRIVYMSLCNNSQ